VNHSDGKAEDTVKQLDKPEAKFNGRMFGSTKECPFVGCVSFNDKEETVEAL
jgi:hypothetical protein